MKKKKYADSLDKDINRNRIMSNILAIVTLLGPAMWTLLGVFNTITEKQRIFSTIVNIPCLLLLGFIWGCNYKDKEVFELAQEADELESELKQLKNK